MASLQGVKVFDQVIDVFLTQALVKGGHRAPAFDDGLSYLRICGRRPAGQGFRLKQSLQLRRLFVQLRVGSLMAICTVNDKKRSTPRLIISKAIAKPRAASQQGRACDEPQSKNSGPGTTSHGRLFRFASCGDPVATLAACSRKAFSSSAAVQSVDQYLATVPSGAIRTMFIVCEI